MGGPADLSVDYAGFRLYIECKRPQGEQKIARRAAEACAQLRDRFKADTHPNQLGIVAVSISKALAAGEMLFVEGVFGLSPRKPSFQREEFAIHVERRTCAKRVGCQICV
jgi:hypothetical protein